MLTLFLFGSFEAYFDDRALEQLTAKKAQALLIYLAVEVHQVHQREAVMALLWPDYPRESAQLNLRQTLHLLRQAMQGNETGAPLILSERYTVTFNPDVPSFIDITRFEQLSKNGRSPQEWQQAIDLYRGCFLADFYLADSEPFEAWVADKRAYYNRRVQELFQRLIIHYLEIEDYGAAETAVRRQLSLDNLQEPAHRQLIEILAKNGRRQEAIIHYDHLCKLLKEELDLEPEPETNALLASIRISEIETSFDSRYTPTHKRTSSRHNLPEQMTSFIGREKELIEITNLLTQNRLVTLTGMGGIGKTNLCLQVARNSREVFSDGVWLVELDSISDPKLLPQTVAQIFGLKTSSKHPTLEILLDYLSRKECLLILDNCEHLIDSVAQFVESVLKTCPHVKILASSREILTLVGEFSFRVPPLSFPDKYHETDATEWLQYEAIQLFVDRATAVYPNFNVTPDNMASLVKICQQLDGIPLALELAAARITMLTVEQIAIRLVDIFHLLTSGSRTALPHQQTLRVLVDWSWELLSEKEQALLQRLAIFSGSMSLDAVEVVCVNGDIDRHEILDLLTALVNKSLVISRRMQGHETRYYLLNIIRQYAWERLEVTGQLQKFRGQHLAYFQQLAETAKLALVGSDQVTWIMRLEREIDNLRVALNWALKTDVEAGLQLSTALSRFWIHEYLREGEVWFTRLLLQSELVRSNIRVEALWVYRTINVRMANYSRARALAEECLALYRELEDPHGIDRCLRVLMDTPKDTHKFLLNNLTRLRTSGDNLEVAEVLFFLGEHEGTSNYEQSVVYFKESMTLYREAGHLAGLVNVLQTYGQKATWQGEYDVTRQLLEESFALQKSSGWRLRGNDDVLTYLGNLYFHLGNYQQARDCLEQCLTKNQQIGDKFNYQWAFIFLGYVFLRMGMIVEAHEVFVKSVHEFSESSRSRTVISGLIFSVEGLASLAVILGDADRATRLFAWADKRRAAIPNKRPRVEQADIDRDITAILDMIGKDTYTTVYAEGQAMTREQAITYALEDVNQT